MLSLLAFVDLSAILVEDSTHGDHQGIKSGNGALAFHATNLWFGISSLAENFSKPVLVNLSHTPQKVSKHVIPDSCLQIPSSGKFKVKILDFHVESNLRTRKHVHCVVSLLCLRAFAAVEWICTKKWRKTWPAFVRQPLSSQCDFTVSSPKVAFSQPIAHASRTETSVDAFSTCMGQGARTKTA